MTDGSIQTCQSCGGHGKETAISGRMHECRAAKVPFFMKQMGGVRKPFAPIPEDLMVREFPND